MILLPPEMIFFFSGNIVYALIDFKGCCRRECDVSYQLTLRPKHVNE